MKTKQYNLDNEDEFFKSSLGRMFELIFKNNKEARFAYKILHIIKQERKGIRVYGYTHKICKYLHISYPYYIKLLKTMKDVGLVEYIKYSSPVPMKQTLKKEETKLDDNVTLHFEIAHKSPFIVLSDSTNFVKFLSSTARDWIRFRKPPLIVELLEEEEKTINSEETN